MKTIPNSILEVCAGDARLSFAFQALNSGAKIFCSDIDKSHLEAIRHKSNYTAFVQDVTKAWVQPKGIDLFICLPPWSLHNNRHNLKMDYAVAHTLNFIMQEGTSYAILALPSSKFDLFSNYLSSNELNNKELINIVS